MKKRELIKFIGKLASEKNEARAIAVKEKQRFSDEREAGIVCWN